MNDPQVRLFLILVAGLVILLSWHLTQTGQGFGNAFRQSSFNAVSIMTGTGYVSANYSAWGGFASTVLLMTMFIGGCGGSTTCGIKVFRLQVLAATARVQISRLLRPHAVVLAYYNRRPVTPEVMDSVMGFFLSLYSWLCGDCHSIGHDGAWILSQRCPARPPRSAMLAPASAWSLALMAIFLLCRIQQNG
jgi:Trk-type K+ transport system membrane component